MCLIRSVWSCSFLGAFGSFSFILAILIIITRSVVRVKVIKVVSLAVDVLSESHTFIFDVLAFLLSQVSLDFGEVFVLVHIFLFSLSEVEDMDENEYFAKIKANLILAKYSFSSISS